MVILLAIGAGVAGLSFWLDRNSNDASTPAGGADPGGPDLSARVPEARFKDITEEAGIRFVHNTGAFGEKLLPETMGGGVAFSDFDGDGKPDLLFVNGTGWPWDAQGRATTAALYRNEGGARFKDVTAGSGLDIPIQGMGVAVGDYDNDGLVDVYLTALGGNRLFRNAGNHQFIDVTAGSGTGGSTNDWSTSAAWIDYDNDGDLDLFVCNYVQWSRTTDLEVNYTLPGLGRAYGPPMNFVGTFPRLYRNEGSGRFTEVSAEAGLQVLNRATSLPMAKSLGVAPVDVNNDGWMDLIIANDTVQNFIFTNRHDGTFMEVGAISGIAFDTYGGTRGAMGIDAARFHDENILGVSIGNFANEMTALYVSDPDSLTFTDQAISQGIGSASRFALTFGVFFFDYDLDGWLDLLTVNGHIEDQIERVHAGQTYRQSAQLFWSASGLGLGARFVLVPEAKCGPDLIQPIVGRGSAFADLDGDGDLDVVLTQVGGPPLLLRNDQALGHRWIRLKLVGTRSNRDAIGAWVRLRTGGRVQWRQVMPTRSYLSQSEMPVTFGLGANEKVSEITVYWPGGERQSVRPGNVNELRTIRQGD